MFTLKSAAAAIGATAVVVLLGGALHARGAISDVSYLTFSGPVSLPGVTLSKGTYIFEHPSQYAPDVVRVLSRDRKVLYFTAFTRSIPRPEGLGNRVVLLGEASAGSARPITAWFPVDEAIGHQFIYGLR